MDITEQASEPFQSRIHSTHLSGMNSLNLLKDIRSLGCSKEEVAAAAYRAYLDLCEVRQFKNVSYHFSPQLDHIFLLARLNEDKEEQIIIPVVGSKSLSFNQIEKYQEAFSSNCISIAICDSSSIIAYYKLSKS